MWPHLAGWRRLELGRPGRLRDRLNCLVLRGEKTATAGLWSDYEIDSENLEEVGERQVLTSSDDEPLAIVEITRVESHPFIGVPWEFARAEGEGFTSIDDWRQRHRAFYATEGVRTLDDDIVVCVWFRVIEIAAPQLSATNPAGLVRPEESQG